jgi:hypothetical protein
LSYKLGTLNVVDPLPEPKLTPIMLNNPFSVVLLRVPPLATTKDPVCIAALTTPLVIAKTTEPRGDIALSKGIATGHSLTVRCLKTSVEASHAPGAELVVGARKGPVFPPYCLAIV